MKYVFGCVALLAAAASVTAADALTFTVTAGKDAKQVTIVSLPWPEKTAVPEAVSVTGPEGADILSQVMPAGGPGSAPGQAHVVVAVPGLKAGQAVTLTVTPQPKSYSDKLASFQWKTENGHPTELRWHGAHDLRVMSFVGDRFDPKQTPPGKTPLENPTIKPYHHGFDPLTGNIQLTNGPQGQYPHHRGVFYGFNRISYDGKQADVWHCRNGESTVAGDPQVAVGGPLFGMHRFPVTWNGQDGKPFAEELRQVTVYHFSNYAAWGTLIDFTSELRTSRESGVKLDGDPQHAGFHFRANSSMEKNAKETYFIRPDGKGESGKETNWDPKTKKGPVNLPWDAMCFMLDGNRYTVLYLDHPDNPKEARQSERCYGRIGTYFEYQLTPKKPLLVHYRLCIGGGELSAEDCDALSKAFTDPVKVAVK